MVYALLSVPAPNLGISPKAEDLDALVPNHGIKLSVAKSADTLISDNISTSYSSQCDVYTHTTTRFTNTGNKLIKDNQEKLGVLIEEYVKLEYSHEGIMEGFRETLPSLQRLTQQNSRYLFWFTPHLLFISSSIWCD